MLTNSSWLHLLRILNKKDLSFFLAILIFLRWRVKLIFIYTHSHLHIFRSQAVTPPRSVSICCIDWAAVPPLVRHVVYATCNYLHVNCLRHRTTPTPCTTGCKYASILRHSMERTCCYYCYYCGLKQLNNGLHVLGGRTKAVLLIAALQVCWNCLQLRAGN